MWLLFLLNLLFGSTFTLGKLALEYSSPLFLISFRMLIAGVLMLAYQYFFNREYWFFKRSHLWLFAQYTIFGIFISYICEFWALQFVSSAKVCMIFSLTPFITAIIAYFFMAERITRLQLIGLIIGFIGCTPIIMTSDTTEAASGAIGVLSYAEIVLLIAVTAASYGWIVMQKLVSDRSYSTIMVNGVSMLAGGILTSITSLVFEGTPHIKIPEYAYNWTLSPFWGSVAAFLLYAFLLIIIANLICFNLYGLLLRYYSATFISFTGFTQPIFASFFGWLILSEGITWHFAVSLVVITLGLYLFYRDELKLAAS